MGGPSRAIVIDRNRTVGRRLARVLTSAGYVAEAREPGDPAPPGPGLLLVAEAEAKDELCRLLRALPGAAGVLYGAGELDAAALLAEPGLQGLLGCRAGTGRLEIEGELLGLARHLRGAALPPMQALLLWGAQAYSAEIHNLAGREAAVARLVELCEAELGAPRRLGSSAGEVAHELLTNAMYDAPVDDAGHARHNADRTAQLELPPEDRPVLRFGADGIRLAIEVEDRFGRLRREHVAGSLRRAAAGQVSQQAGGAGIGIGRVLRAASCVTFDVEPGRRTRVTAILEIDPPRDGGNPGAAAPRAGRGLIFPAHPGLGAGSGAEGSRPAP